MSAILPGYNYDIFISYRQKDNRHDGWVTEFVNNLKDEIESTFKEEISVYFDINPHDGLLETHDVDESLKEKLKCLIFIPIISRTYCDPKSFAWEHEFRAFVEMASKDQFGLKVKLANGNVASRVLPVQIHELDIADKKLLEAILGGQLRGIEFIYAEPGVNKPLSHDLNPNKYNIRVNKAANAVKELIQGISGASEERDVAYRDAATGIKKKVFFKPVLWILLFLIIGALAFLLRKHVLSSAEVEKSIAVIPFINDSPEAANGFFINGLFDEIINNLQTIKSFSKVVPRASVEKYRKTEKSIPEIARELGVNFIISGSGQKSGRSFRLRLTMTDAENKVLWGHPYEGTIDTNYFAIQLEIAQAIALELNSVISPEEKEAIGRILTPDLTAYDFYLQGKEEYARFWLHDDSVALKKAEVKYRQALQYDPEFAEVYAELARVYIGKNLFRTYYSESFLDSVPILCSIAIRYNNRLADAYSILGDYYREKGEYQKAIEDYDKSLRLNPNAWESYFGKATIYWGNDLVQTIDNYLISASLNHGRELADILYWISHAYTTAGFADKSLHFANEFFKLNGDSNLYTYNRFMAEIYAGNYMKAAEQAERLLALDSANADPMTLFFIAYNYSMLGQNIQSLKYFRKMTELSDLKPESYGRPGSEHRIGYAYWMIGDTAKAYSYVRKALKNSIKQVELKRSISQKFFSYYDIAADYAFLGQRDSSFKYLRLFNQKPVIFRWFATYMKIDPLFKNISNEPEFREILEDVERKYQAEHERVKKWLEENNML